MIFHHLGSAGRIEGKERGVEEGRKGEKGEEGRKMERRRVRYGMLWEMDIIASELDDSLICKGRDCVQNCSIISQALLLVIISSSSICTPIQSFEVS